MQEIYFNTLNLILDWGNTNLKAAIFRNKNEPETFVFQIDECKNELTDLVKSNNFSQIIISSVVNNPAWLAPLLEKQNVLYLTHSTSLPIQLDYSTPETLGNDRIANVVAAKKLKPNQNTLVIDIGTCLKFDFINSKANYEGGSISPGFSMRFKSLNQNTDKLPLIENNIPENFVGNSTKKSISSGVYFGMLAEIEGIINQYETRYSNLNIFITGGDAFYFEKALKKTIFAHSFLTLYGLNEILNYNAE